MNNIFDRPMIESICKTIGDRLAGKVDDETYTRFIEGTTQLGAKAYCSRCEDTGLVFLKDIVNNTAVARCYCVYGDRRSKKYIQIKRR